MAVAPFPYAWLPRWSRAEAAHTRAVLRRLLPVAPASREEPLGPSLHALLGGPCEAWPLAPRVLASRTVRARHDGVSLAAVLHHGALGTMGALIDAPFARTLAARALGSDDAAARRIGAETAFTPAHEGALALLCAQASQRVFGQSPPAVVRAVSDRVADLLDAMAVPEDQPLLVWPWRVTLGLQAGDVTLVLDARRTMDAPRNAGDGLRQTDGLDVTMDVLLARATLDAAVCVTLGPRDVLLCEGTDTPWLAAGAYAIPLEESPQGYTIAGPARAKRSVAVATNEGDADDRAVQTRVLTELPIEIELVLGRATFSVGEVAAWRVGEVVALPTKLGEPVLVRAGGRIVARGELCDVDGAVGVRVTERL